MDGRGCAGVYGTPGVGGRRRDAAPRDEHLTVAGFTHLRTRCGLDEAWPSYYAQRDRQDELADEIAADLGLEEVPPPPLIAICDDSPETAKEVLDYDAMLVSQLAKGLDLSTIVEDRRPESILLKEYIYLVESSLCLPQSY